MVQEFLKKSRCSQSCSTLHIRLDMTFDIPEEIADQLELWGLNVFDTCEYDPKQRQLKMSANTALYREEV